MSRKEQNSAVPWSPETWEAVEALTAGSALKTRSDVAAWNVLARSARQVLKTYSTSFFIVTRFLPPTKRARVEAVYAAVRYPDEVVDSFRISSESKTSLLDHWESSYLAAVEIPSVRERLAAAIPCFVSSFAEVVRQAEIPVEHYQAFLAAMRHDISPRRFASIDDLIESYVYGSAIVVGYFLAYVYGPSSGTVEGPVFKRTLEASRELGIALQLTNFLRDVAEDQRRGRLYLPLDWLSEAGATEPDATNRDQVEAFSKVLQKVGLVADSYYGTSSRKLDAFAPDCRVAIRACIDVYGQLNRQIMESNRGIEHRESVPMRRKFQVLPVSKYWRLPLAYLS